MSVDEITEVMIRSCKTKTVNTLTTTLIIITDQKMILKELSTEDTATPEIAIEGTQMIIIQDREITKAVVIGDHTTTINTYPRKNGFSNKRKSKRTSKNSPQRRENFKLPAKMLMPLKTHLLKRKLRSIKKSIKK